MAAVLHTAKSWVRFPEKQFMTRPKGSENSSIHPAIRTPTQCDLGWAAGFLEGEGSFTCNGTSERVTAPQVNPEPLIQLLEIFGGKVTRAKRDTIWEWRVFGARARGVMLTLFPLLSEKRKQQIKNALKALQAKQSAFNR